MHKSIATLHYLTQDVPGFSHTSQVQMACEAGIRWIQLRIKNSPYQEWLKIAEEVRMITMKFNTTLIINDNPSIAKNVEADGVHLGRNDMSVNDARNMLGDEFIIGLSAHSLKELIESRGASIDYVGLGPFHFTQTKNELDPVLGLQKFRERIAEARLQGSPKPIIAIGGIKLNDVENLFNAGADGVAVSSAINLSPAPADAMAQFIDQIKIFQNQEIL